MAPQGNNERVKLTLAKHLPLSGRISGLTFAAGAKRLLISRGGEGTLIADAKSGKEITTLAEDSSVGPLDPGGTIAAVSSGGKTVGGRYQWSVWLCDLASGKKIGALATCTPDDNISIAAIGRSRVLGIRKQKTAYSAILFDHAGKKVAEHPLGKVPLPFHAALSPDEELVAHAYFTGEARVLTLRTGKGQKLQGGTLRIGRQHDNGITSLAFDATGTRIFYESPAMEVVHVWDVATRKSLAGAWSKIRVQEAFVMGDALTVASSGSQDAIVTSCSLTTGKAAPRPREIVAGKGSMHFAYAGDARHVACAGNTARDAFAKGSLELWDLLAGKRVAKGVLPRDMKTVSALGAGPGMIAVGDLKGFVALYTFG